MLSLCRLVVFGLLLTLFPSPGAFGKIEAVKGKRYVLAPVHGPWMIMVASLRDVPIERRTRTGLSAWQAADQLVYELRLQGIPAYTYLRGEEIASASSATSGDDRKYIAQHEFIAVMAGNFKSPEEDDARIILEFIQNEKKFSPSFLAGNGANGGLFARTPGRPGPLSRAMIVPNPLRPMESRQTIDPVVKRLNADMEYSLLKNPGKYTLVVATFAGNTVTQVGHREPDKAMKLFEKQFGNGLDKSAYDAWQFAEALRDARKLGYDQNYEAYVFHDRYSSVVTIGSFDNPNDPRMRKLAQLFAAKSRLHKGKTAQVAEIFTVPRNPGPGRQADKVWMFDPAPRRMEVPKVN